MTVPASTTGVQDRITAYWDHRADAYDAHQERVQTPPVRDAWRRIWGEVLPDAPADVLDLGTGTGEVAVLLAGLGHRVTATDLAADMLDIARRRSAGLAHPPQLQVGDAVAPDLPPASFDVVTCRYVLWTLREPVAALTRWRALLRPGGRLVVVDSTWFPTGIHAEGDRRPDGPPEFADFYDPTVAAALPLAEAGSIEPSVRAVRDAGFVDVEVTPLHELERLQRAAAVDSDHTVRLQYRITGRCP
ncbi:class I SAM-dependent methyltransferase [Egicoccus halophilus]|uniref:Methyltransferase type 11 domain-containing protein n=1 Tax=Egicoccus halophilus TaxID=1670830 RepID=A0A8J3A879_9ACTN|nr:class I SAM-dependent methyltransferase [Egicoccus halophilus]GGI06210.1 hypothetical protein GCM10011354_17950 [Egicoccus halophilus]